MDLRIDWMTRAEQETQIPRIVSDTLIALVNAGMGERSAAAGRLIYDANPDCLLVYYGEGRLESLLWARPAAYNPDLTDADGWKKLLSALLDRIMTARGCFHWSGKDRCFRLPWRSITHVRSERVYLDVFTTSGASFRMVGKLDEAAKQLAPPYFLRIHQSELVNLDYVRALDRSCRCLIMDDGSELYISRVHYRQVLKQLGEDRS